MESGYLVGGEDADYRSDPAEGPPGAITSNTFVSNDRGVWDGDLLMITGRTDSVVKVRGFRVDLSGVEAQMLACAHVTDGALVAYEDSLWACVVTSDLAAVQAYVAQAFDVATRPVVLIVSEIPYTATGKRDRKQLKASLPDLIAARTVHKSHDSEGLKHLSSADATECAVVLTAMQAALGFPVGPDDDFFGSGGTSLKAIRFALAIGLPIAAVFASPTARQLARLLHTRHGSPETETTADGESASSDPLCEDPRCEVISSGSLSMRSLWGGVGTMAPVSIAGMAVHLPGGVSNLYRLWQKLHVATDLIGSLPAAVSRGAGYIDRKGMVSLEGMPSAATRDALRIPAEAAARMGPEQRLALEVAVAALRDAGYESATVPARTGVFFSTSSLYHPKADLDEMRSESPDLCAFSPPVARPSTLHHT